MWLVGNADMVGELDRYKGMWLDEDMVGGYSFGGV